VERLMNKKGGEIIGNDKIDWRKMNISADMIAQIH
jgi:hypothetical protein